MIAPQTLRKAGFASLALASGALVMGLFSGSSTGKLSYQIGMKPTVMTVAYKAYGNGDAADGKYWLSRLVLENDGDGALEDVEVSYRIPDYIDWTTPRSIDEILPGQTRVLPIYPKLPTKITSLRSRTPSSLEIKFAWNDGSKSHEKIEVRQFEFRGVNEIEYTSLPSEEMLTWHDMYDNAEICAAYVTDEDPVVRQYLGEVAETMGGMPICSNEAELKTAMESIYVYQLATGMSYSGNKGVPENLGDSQSTVQNVRLPRDVIYQNSGLCIELAMLWGALGQGSSAKVYLALVPGHCFPVLEANDGSVIAIESTGIGGSNLGGHLKFQDAVDAGNKQLGQLLRGEIPGVLLDVVLHQSRGIRPPEFEAVNLADLARLLDERTAKALASADDNRQANNDPTPSPAPNPDNYDPVPSPDPNPTPNPPVNGQWQWHKVAGLAANVPYPAGYAQNTALVGNLQQHIPAVKFIASSQDGANSVEIYAASGLNGQRFLGSFQSLAKKMGGSLQYAQPENVRIGGNPGTLHSYTFQQQNQTLTGGMYIYETTAGLFAFAVGGTDPNWRTLGNQIAGNIQFGGN